MRQKMYITVLLFTILFLHFVPSLPSPDSRPNQSELPPSSDLLPFPCSGDGYSGATGDASLPPPRRLGACSSQAPTPTAYIEPPLPAPGARAVWVQAAFHRSAARRPPRRKSPPRLPLRPSTLLPPSGDPPGIGSAFLVRRPNLACSDQCIPNLLLLVGYSNSPVCCEFHCWTVGWG